MTRRVAALGRRVHQAWRGLLLAACVLLGPVSGPPPALAETPAADVVRRQGDAQAPGPLRALPLPLVQGRAGEPGAEVPPPGGPLQGMAGLHLGIHLGIGLTMTLLCAAAWLATRQPLWLISSLFGLGSLALSAAQLGAVAQGGLPGAEGLTRHLPAVANCAHLSLASLFLWQLLKLFKLPGWCTWPCLGTAALLPVLLGLLALGQPAAALGLNTMLTLGLSLWTLAVAWFIRPPDRLLRLLGRGLCLGLALYTLSWLSPWVSGLVPPTAPSLHPALPGDLITMLATVLILARTTQLQVRAARRLALDKHAADQLLVHERRQHEETAGFLSMLVHEVRNPLALVQVVARNIASGRTPPGEAQAVALRKIDRAVQDISAVLERCVETDLLERGALAARPQPDDAAARLRAWLARHHDRARIQATLPDTLPANLDADLWLAMVRNLVENALKYAPEGAPVQLRLQADGAQLRVDVSNPPGPAGRPDAARLFSKYYRSDRAAGITGTGLGLYWVQQLSGRLGGAVQCLHTSAQDGADAPVVFRLSLPR